MAISDITSPSGASLDARAIDNESLATVGRIGWVAKGVVYAVMGFLAVPIAFGSGGQSEQASRSGALQEIAEQSYGGVLLALVGVGLMLYALWRLATALMPGDTDAEGMAHRIGYLASAGLYGFLAWSAVSFVVTDGGSGAAGGSGGGGESSLEKISRTMLEVTGGRWLLGLAAVGGLGVASFFAVKGIDGSFKDRLDLSDASTKERQLIEASGKLGWVGRGITTALLAVFVLQAAITSNPDEAKGLDAALRSTADSWWGTALIVLAGVGLIAYGVFAVLSARHRRLLGP